jgi:hypothetical protein
VINTEQERPRRKVCQIQVPSPALKIVRGFNSAPPSLPWSEIVALHNPLAHSTFAIFGERGN